MGKNKFVSKYLPVGPAVLVTAAFIGPGTITTCSLAGAKFEFALLWGILFSVVATIILQEMSARLGIVSRKGLGEALRSQMSNPFIRIVSTVLVISAIVIGNAAYQTGNLLGASMGIEAITGIDKYTISGVDFNIWSILIGSVAFVILIKGSYKLLERFLVVLVLVMSFVFLTTAIFVFPDFGKILQGLVIPSMPPKSALTVVALIGTTVVPYNLFLHASAVQERWKNSSDLPKARKDTIVSIIVGGIISMAIVVASAATIYGSGIIINSAGDMALQLQPLLGSWAKIFMSVGLFAAGISSSITAPLAAAYAMSGILGWGRNMKSIRFRAVWATIILIGIVLSGIGLKPVQAIQFAQAANGLLLPLIAIFLLFVMNNKKLLGNYVNKTVSNVLGVIIVIITILLGVKSILGVFGLL
jgi:NRAMP (natural resistance-associated macrophage protein)-like metal ion transporter